MLNKKLIKKEFSALLVTNNRHKNFKGSHKGSIVQGRNDLANSPEFSFWYLKPVIKTGCQFLPDVLAG